MNRFIIDGTRDLLSGFASRAGTAFAAFLVAQGVPADHAHQAMLAAGVLAALAFDLAAARFLRKT